MPPILARAKIDQQGIHDIGQLHEKDIILFDPEPFKVYCQSVNAPYGLAVGEPLRLPSYQSRPVVGIRNGLCIRRGGRIPEKKIHKGLLSPPSLAGEFPNLPL